MSRFFLVLFILMFAFAAHAQTFVQGKNFIQYPTSVVTAGATTTLTTSSGDIYQFTGTTTQTLVMANATSLQEGRLLYVANDSTGTVTVNANGGGLLLSMPGSSRAYFRLMNNGAAAGTWSIFGANSVDVTIGTANGLTISGQALSLGTASTSTTGALTSTDWNTFNSKEPALTFNAPLVDTANTVTCNVASGSQAGCLSSTDWTTFNNKSPAGNFATSGTGDVTWSAPSGPGAVTTSIAATTNSTLATLSGLTTAGSLATVGTIGTGAWQGTKVAITYGGTNASSAAAGTIPQASSTTASTWTATPTLGVNGTTSGTLALTNSTSGSGSVTLANQGTTSANAYTFNFPTTAGTANYVLKTDGSGNTSWVSALTNPMTTLGDIIVGGSSGTPERVAVGTDGFAVVANSNATYGVDYEDVSTPGQLRNAGFSTSISSSALTVTLTQYDGSTAPTTTSPVRAVMRSSTSTSGAYVKRNITATLTQTFTTGSGLGLGAQAQDLWLYLIDSDGAGTMKIGASAVLYDETALQSTVAESFSATATNASPCVFTASGHGMTNNDAVSLTGTAPTGFSNTTIYYVVAKAANTFELSATPGGTAINSSSTGSSIVVHYNGYKIASAGVYTSEPIRVLGKVNETFATIGTWISVNSAALQQAVPTRQNIAATLTNSSTSISGSASTITWTNITQDTLNGIPGKITYIVPATGTYNINASLLESATYSASAINIYIQQNGTTIKLVENITAAFTGNIATEANVNFPLSQNDLITVQTANGGTTPTISTSTTQNIFSITKTGN